MAVGETPKQLGSALGREGSSVLSFDGDITLSLVSAGGDDLTGLCVVVLLVDFRWDSFRAPHYLIFLVAILHKGWASPFGIVSSHYETRC